MLRRVLLCVSIVCASGLATASRDLPSAQACAQYTRLFAPPARVRAFRFSCTRESIQVVSEFYRRNWPSPEPRSWTIERLAAADAFDRAALFNRSQLARLYGGLQPRVARGPVTRDGRVVEVVMLLSPYPEPDLSALNAGTLIMTVQLRPER